jgi:hypothetical protein
MAEPAPLTIQSGRSSLSTSGTATIAPIIKAAFTPVQL